jgi:hypothetical protein
MVWILSNVVLELYFIKIKKWNKKRVSYKLLKYKYYMLKSYDQKWISKVDGLVSKLHPNATESVIADDQYLSINNDSFAFP